MTSIVNAPAEQADRPVPALRARGLAKRFGAQLALSGVDLDIEQGEVLALLGENGSGKSTLVKILSGFHAPEPGGHLQVAGRDVPLPVPHENYRDFGLSFVYQDLGLGFGLRVVENLFVGRRVRGTTRILHPIGWGRERRAAQAVFDRYHVDLDPNATVGSLRPTAQALLAIVRAAEDLRLFRERMAAASGQESETPHGVLVLDEPTVFLPEDEKVFLFELVHQVRQRGTAVLFVSHDLPAIRELADRAVILRDGAAIADVTIADTPDEQLVELISGHHMSATVERAATRAVESVTDAEPAAGASAADASGVRVSASGVAGGQLRDVAFSVAAGEIVGVAGLLGSGVEDLPYALFGALPGASGQLRIGDVDHDLAHFSPRAARTAGLALVPADRAQQGIAPALTVGENMMSLVIDQYFSRGLLARSRLRRTAGQRARAFGVRPPNPNALISSLSGGNQQRVVLARWLEDQPRVLILHEPTQGVDVGTRAEINGMLRHLAATGVSIIWVSTDFDELADVAQRVLICSDGVIAAQVDSGPITRDRITAEVYAAGARTAAPASGTPRSRTQGV
ncbi:sugar ABC transporter ATP-binding protein [Microbacterium kribbense]|uniref:Sugar ABC transporter ATP-binding protein n=1 Tax=Microbacterium kribbense TaxID=433645 RepID=A0ABP7G2J4_9MICO